MIAKVESPDRISGEGDTETPEYLKKLLTQEASAYPVVTIDWPAEDDGLVIGDKALEQKLEKVRRELQKTYIKMALASETYLLEDAPAALKNEEEKFLLQLIDIYEKSGTGSDEFNGRIEANRKALSHAVMDSWDKLQAYKANLSKTAYLSN